MIVVDSNVIAYFLIQSEQRPLALALRDRDPEWAAPFLWRSEFRNVLAGYLRRGTMTFDQILERQLEAERLMAGSEYQLDSRKILELVRDSACTAYDCEFIALARQLGTKLFTMDAKLLRAFPDDAVSLTSESAGSAN